MNGAKDLNLHSLITSRVEVNILRSINPHFAKVKVINNWVCLLARIQFN